MNKHRRRKAKARRRQRALRLPPKTAWLMRDIVQHFFETGAFRAAIRVFPY